MLAYELLPGGQVATAVLAAARLGLRAAYVGSVGSDPAADPVLAPLAGAGVDVSRRAARRRRDDTARGHPGRSRERRAHRARLPRSAPAAPREPLRRPRSSGAGPAGRRRRSRCVAGGAAAARRAGVPVVADVDAGGAGRRGRARAVDFPLVSRSFAETVRLDRSQWAARTPRTRRAMAVATLGERGCLARHAEHEIASPRSRSRRATRPAPATSSTPHSPGARSKASRRRRAAHGERGRRTFVSRPRRAGRDADARRARCVPRRGELRA